MNFRSLSTDDGLSNFVVTNIYKDSTGFIWIGTDQTLDRFDGVNFKHYYFNTEEINKKRVFDICEMQAGRLFVSNGLGLWRLDNDHSQLERYYPGIINSMVNVLKYDTVRKVMYAGSEEGIYVIQSEGEPKFIPLDKNVMSETNFVFGIAIGNDDQLWVTTKTGLCELDLRTGKVNLYRPPLPAGVNSVLAKVEILGDKLFIGSSKNGIFSFNTQTHQFSNYLQIGSNIITDLSSDGKDLLYAATDGNGAHIISVSQNKILQSLQSNSDDPHSIRSNSIYSLLVDRNNIIWLGYYQTGLEYSLYQNPLLKTYGQNKQFNTEKLSVRTFLLEKDVKLLGTKHGLYLLQGENGLIRNYSSAELRSNLVLATAKYAGKYYVGTYGGGVSVIEPGSWKVSPMVNDFALLNGHVFHFEKDRSGNLWLATSEGVYKYNDEKGTLISYTSSNSQLYPGNVYYMYFDRSGNAWIATQNGLCILDRNTNSIKSNIFPKDFFNKEIIKSIYEDSEGKIYFLPDKGNIFYSDENMRSFGRFEATKRFENAIFSSITEDLQNNLWLGTNNGLIFISKDKTRFRSFNYVDGIQDPLFNATASYCDSEGILWFGNSSGLLYLDPKDINPSTENNFPIQFTDLEINGASAKGVLLSKFHQKVHFTLKYFQDNINIEFVSLQFTQPGTIVYVYKLEGFDSDWNVLGYGQNKVHYNDLPPGEYVFKVKTEGSDASQSELKFKIESFFNLRFWVIFLSVLLVMYFSANRIWHNFKRLKNAVSKKISGESEEKYKHVKIEKNECEQLVRQLHKYVKENKPYVNPDLKIHDLSEALNTSSHTLSFVFSQHLNTSYYDYINAFRIEEFKKMVNDPANSKYTLLALSEKCGFNSRASFFRSFKKIAGQTPNEYIKSIGKFHQID